MQLPTEDELRAVLRTVEDPELGMNIVDLGLIYRVEIAAQLVRIEMTMTSAACPMGSMIADNVRKAASLRVPAGTSIEVVLVWDPPWTPDRMSQGARQILGWPG